MIGLFLLQNCHAAAKVTETAGRHMPHMRFLGTNWCDVQLTFIICVSIVAIALLAIIVLAILCWQRKKLNIAAIQTDVEQIKEQVNLGTNETKSIKDDLKNTNRELEKIKNSPAYQAAALFKDICSMSKNEKGIVDNDIAEKLFVLYQNIKKDYSDNQ